jgi:DNA mismatch endonuclease, patch repair protein
MISMTDQLTSEGRSALMARIRGKDTKPELIVRRMLRRMGYRFHVHRRDLPGTPDIVFPNRRKAIFVHGCFWHGHGCKAGQLPKSRVDFWAPKIAGNRSRDARKAAALRRSGWSVAVLWECRIRDPIRLERRLRIFLGRDARSLQPRQ